MPAINGGISITLEGELTAMLAGNAQGKASAAGTLSGGQVGGAQGLAEWLLFDGSGSASAGRPITRATGYAEWPLFGGEGLSGVIGAAGWPLFEGSGIASATISARGEADWEPFEGSGTATAFIVARGEAIWSPFVAEGLAGAVGLAEWDWFDATGVADTPIIARGLSVWDLFDASGTATALVVARGSVEWPLFEAGGLAGAAGLSEWDVFEAIGRASAPFATGWETTYAVNVNTAAVSSLTLGAADRLATAHGALYLLKDGSLYRLDANTDLGQPIRAHIRLAPNPLGTNHVKRASEIYLSVRQHDGVILETVADETESWRYFRPPAAWEGGYATCKVEVGQGVHFYTLGLILRNRSGGAFEIGGLEAIIQPLSKRPR